MGWNHQLDEYGRKRNPYFKQMASFSETNMKKNLVKKNAKLSKEA